MKRRVILTAGALLALTASVAVAAPTETRAVHQRGGAGHDGARAVSTAPDGFLVAGHVGEGSMPTAGRSDGLLRRTDPEGHELWAVTTGGPESDQLTDVEWASGDIIVTGTTTGTTVPGGSDGFVERRNGGDGSLVWHTPLASGAAVEVSGVAIDESTGDAVVVGTTSGAAPTQPDEPIGDTDGFIVRLDTSTGAVTEVAKFGTLNDDRARAVAVTSTGTTIVGGSTHGALGGPLTGARGDRDAFAIAFDQSGATLWAAQVGTPIFDRGEAVTIDSAGRAYLAGTVGGTLPGQQSAGASDAFVRAFDADTGEELWTRQLGTSLADAATALAVGNFGSPALDGPDHLYVAGVVGGELDGFDSAGGATDMFAARLGPAGGIGWIQQLGSYGRDDALGIASDGAHVAVGGTTSGDLPGATSNGGDDEFLVVFEPDVDGDGLGDHDEVHIHGTDPASADTDGDGLRDDAELFEHHTDPTQADTDGDGLGDGDEVHRYRSDPNNPDTDGDTLTDGDEVHIYGTSPTRADTDRDGLRDDEEINTYGTNPRSADTDRDCRTDGEEVERGTDPLDPDEDGNGIPDGGDDAVSEGAALDPNALDRGTCLVKETT